jgi:hypothetical protein
LIDLQSFQEKHKNNGAHAKAVVTGLALYGRLSVSSDGGANISVAPCNGCCECAPQTRPTSSGGDSIRWTPCPKGKEAKLSGQITLDMFPADGHHRQSPGHEEPIRCLWLLHICDAEDVFLVLRKLEQTSTGTESDAYCRIGKISLYRRWLVHYKHSVSCLSRHLAKPKPGSFAEDECTFTIVQGL